MIDEDEPFDVPRVLINGVKLCAFANAWDEEQIQDPHQGVRDHLDKLEDGKALWFTTRMFADDSYDVQLAWVTKQYLDWSTQLMRLYRYLLETSSEPFPGSLANIGQKLIPKPKEVSDDSAESLNKMARRIEDTVLTCSAAMDQEAEVQGVKTRLDLYQSMFTVSHAERVRVEWEIDRLRHNLRISSGRERYQEYFMDSLVGYQRFVASALKVVSPGEPHS